MGNEIFRACREVEAVEAARALGLQFDRNKRAHCPLCGSSRANMAFGKGMFHCHACHAGGDAVKLVSLVLNISPLDAARWVNREFNCGYDEGSNTVSDEARQRINLRQLMRRQEARRAMRRHEYCELVVWAQQYMRDNNPLTWEGMTDTYRSLMCMQHLFDTIWNAGTDPAYIPGGWLDEEVNRLAAIKHGTDADGAGQCEVDRDKSGGNRPVRRRIADGRPGHSGVLHAVHPHGT